MLGFSDGRVYVHIMRDGSTLWHRFDGDDKIPIKDCILTGRITQIKKNVYKEQLQVFVQGDFLYVLVSGIGTNFSRQIMAAIASFKPEDLGEVIKIKPEPGKSKDGNHKTVLCNLILRGKTILLNNRHKQDAMLLFRQASEALGAVRAPSAAPPVAQPQRHPQDLRPEKAAATAPTTAKQLVDWEKVCKDLRINSTQLRELAAGLGLPTKSSDLTSSQAASLYQAAHRRFAHQAEPSSQMNLLAG